MLKQRIIAVLTGLVLLATVAGSAGIAADSLGLFVTSQAQACSGSACNCSGGSGGGGC